MSKKDPADAFHEIGGALRFRHCRSHFEAMHLEMLKFIGQLDGGPTLQALLALFQRYLFMMDLVLLRVDRID